MEYKLTTEQREALQPYEKHLHTALYASYVVGLDNRTARILFDIYNKIFDAHERNMSCNYCVMKVCTHLARLYFVPSEEPKAPAPKKIKKAKK